jgi:hypothetical protein
MPILPSSNQAGTGIFWSDSQLPSYGGVASCAKVGEQHNVKNDKMAIVSLWNFTRYLVFIFSLIETPLVLQSYQNLA